MIKKQYSCNLSTLQLDVVGHLTPPVHKDMTLFYLLLDNYIRAPDTCYVSTQQACPGLAFLCQGYGGQAALCQTSQLLAKLLCQMVRTRLL